MAIVAEGNRGRVYLPPSIEHESIAGNAALEDAPETSLPEKALGFRVQRYGMTRHRDLFTPRQLTALTSFSNLVQEARKKSSPTPEQLVTPQHMQTQFALFSVSQWTDV